MLKSILTMILAILIIITLAACGGENETNSEVSSEANKNESSETSKTTVDSDDTIPPVFIGTENGRYPIIIHNTDLEVDFLEGVEASDNITKDEAIIITVIDDGGYDKTKIGEYTITLQAEDESGNKTTVIRIVEVVQPVAVKTIVTIKGYNYNEESALEYTSSGTKFRSSDIIQVMTKEFFINEYDKYSANHTNNAFVPYFPNGVLMVVDNDMNIIELRIAAGETIQVDADDTVKTSGFMWTNSIDADNGGGLFKGFYSQLDDLLSDGGYVIFVGNTTPEEGRNFMISSFFNSNYTGGATSSAEKNININLITIKLEQ